MPEWFYPLMLVVILAGYVFLYLQGCVLRREEEARAAALARRLDALERSIRELATRPAEAPAVPQAIARVESTVAAIGSAIEEIQGGIHALWTARPPVDPPAAPAAVSNEGEPNESPAETARRYLAGEGFSSVEVTGDVATEDGRRLLVTGFHGDQRRFGHVILREGRVVDAVLAVPARFFP